MFMDLSKAFDTIHHDWMIAKLGAYGFWQDALQYMRSYLINRLESVWVKANLALGKTVLPEFLKAQY